MKCIDCKLARKTIIFGILTLIITVLSYNFLDMKVVNIIHTSDLFVTSVSNFADLISTIFSPKIWALITVIVTLISIITYLKTQKRSSKFYTMSLALIATIFIITVLKVLLARYRPAMLLFDDKYGFHFLSIKKAYNSMPSGHTALTFVGVLSIANFFNKKYITLIAIIIGCIVAASRIIILGHFVSDVILAAYIGIFTYLWAKSLIENNKSN